MRKNRKQTWRLSEIQLRRIIRHELRLLRESKESDDDLTGSSMTWYQPTAVQLRMMAKSKAAIEESFPVYYPFDSTKSSKKWTPATSRLLSECYIALTDSQLTAIVNSTPGKAIKSLGERKLHVESPGPAKHVEEFNSGVLVDGTPKKQFWTKPSGVDPAQFASTQLEKWIQKLEHALTARVAHFEHLGSGVYYHATTQDLKVGDIIKPYWTKETLKTREGSMIGGYLGSQAEDFIESHRPKGAPSRQGSVYAFETPEEAAKWGMSETRKIVAVKPLTSNNIKVDMTVLQSLALLWQDDGFEEDEIHVEGKKMVENYWKGKPVRGRPRWEILIDKGAEVVAVEP